MESLIAKANAIRPSAKRRKTDKDDVHRQSTSSAQDRTLGSVSQHTSLPKSLRTNSPQPENVPKYAHIPNKKLRTQLTRQSTHAARAKTLVKDAELLLTEEGGGMVADGELERTWRIGQEDIAMAAGMEAAKGRKEWVLEGGPYRSRYTRNGRCVFYAIFHP